MDQKPDPSLEKKLVNKARSYNNGSPPAALKLKSEPAKRKSYGFNEAVRSLDLALGRLKKIKLNGEEYSATIAPPNSIRRGGTSAEMFMDMDCPSSNINPGIDNASLMSMNFSHYELMRNLSHSTSNSEGAFSGTTCNNAYSTPADSSLKDEHLEKYFRSAEMWTRKCGDPNSSVHFEVPEK